MVRRAIWILIAACALTGAASDLARAQQPQAYGYTWGGTYGARDWNRFYHYPYVYYPQNFWGREYYRSSNSMYYRYPPEMRIPVYNKKWHNPLPAGRRYHWGHQFVLDQL